MWQTDKSALVSRAYNELSIQHPTERNELLINPQVKVCFCIIITHSIFTTSLPPTVVKQEVFF